MNAVCGSSRRTLSAYCLHTRHGTGMLLWTALIVDTVARDLSRVLFTQEEYGCTIFIPPSVDDTARGPSADAEVV
ncbi:hypothetical protein SMMN14_03868, partial [Sphaerulina musiva]